jgi:hypothetical protein
MAGMRGQATRRAYRCRARAHRAGRADVLPRVAALRLHGDAERAEGARRRAQAQLAFRHHVDLILPVAASVAKTPRLLRAITTAASGGDWSRRGDR